MDRNEALKTLGLTEGDCAPATVNEAAQKLLAEVSEKKNKAPTPNLKDKFSQLELRIQHARSVLLKSGVTIPGEYTKASDAPQSGNSQKNRSSSKLSETKIADLPEADDDFAESASAGSENKSAQFKPGQKLANRYVIGEQIGRGGMGAVYRAYDPNRDKEIAIKVLLPHLMANTKARERFLQEARLSSEMSHPNIVTVFDVQQDGNTHFLTMELLEGGTLRSAIEQKQLKRESFSVEEALNIILPLASALAYAHEKTIHRDIKPENIWITTQGKPKVMDFGIARLMANTNANQSMLGVGTAYYMAPEQFNGKGVIDGRSDQYSVAVMLYELLADHVPIGRIDPLSKIRKEVPTSLSNAVDKALSGRPEDRYPTMNEFVEALSQKSSLDFGKLLDIGGVLNGRSTGFGPRLVTGIAFLIIAGVGYQYISSSTESRQKYLEKQVYANSLLKELQGKAQQLERDAESSRRSQKERDEAFSKTTDKDERENLIKESLRFELRSADFQAALSSFDTAMSEGDDLSTIEAKIRASEADHAAKNEKEALEKLEPALNRLIKLKEAADGVIKKRQSERQELVTSIGGSWSLFPDCKQKFSIASKNNALEMDGSKEVIVNFKDKTVTTMTTLPLSQYGTFTKYERTGNKLNISQAGSSTTLYSCR